MKEERNYEKLKEEALNWGIDLFGVADLKGVERLKVLELPEDITSKFPYAISMGIALCKGVMEEIIDHPTLFYLHHYRQANYVLDQIGFRISKLVEKLGGKALPIAASQIVDWEHQMAHIDHKTIAELAGLGWRGKNNLLVTPQYGARVRLVTILTDLELKADMPYQGPRCEDCEACKRVCPAQAIGDEVSQFDHIKCFEKLKEFRKKYNLNQYICGICVRACGPKV
jgi:epoxyqueuosine reductase QueG